MTLAFDRWNRTVVPDDAEVARVLASKHSKSVVVPTHPSMIDKRMNMPPGGPGPGGTENPGDAPTIGIGVGGAVPVGAFQS